MIAPSRYLRYPRLALSVGASRIPFLGTESDDWPACFLRYHSNLLRLRALLPYCSLMMDDGCPASDHGNHMAANGAYQYTNQTVSHSRPSIGSGGSWIPSNPPAGEGASPRGGLCSNRLPCNVPP